MDLKNTISKTDTLKNDLKLAKDKINDKIISGGGTIADTLNAVPDTIDKMLKENYKKVAIIDTEQFKFADNREFSTFRLATNFEFTPSICFLQAHALAGVGGSGQIIAVDAKKLDFVEGAVTEIRNIQIKQDEIVFNAKTTNTAFDKVKFRVVAIE